MAYKKKLPQITQITAEEKISINSGQKEKTPADNADNCRKKSVKISIISGQKEKTPADFADNRRGKNQRKSALSAGK